MPPSTKSPQAREEIATVLFLDAVGFSAASLKRSPVDAFRELKAMFDRVTRLVREHGGRITTTRRLLLGALFDGPAHRTAEELAEAA